MELEKCYIVICVYSITINGKVTVNSFTLSNNQSDSNFGKMTAHNHFYNFSFMERLVTVFNKFNGNIN